MTNIPLKRHFSRQRGGSYQHHNFSHKYEPPPMQFFPFLLPPSFTVYLAISIAMLSTVSAVFASVEPMPVSPFQSFENGFPPWDCFDPFSSSPHQSPKPDGSSSGSDKSIQSDQNPDNSNSNSGSDDPNPQVSVIDERKRRRMISNRESARRSRMRKQKHVENLRNQVNQLRIENRELTNRLRFVLYHSHGVRTDYDRLQSEYSTLRKKLSDMSQFLMTRQLQQFTSEWPCNNMITATSTEQVAPSLITS